MKKIIKYWNSRSTKIKTAVGIIIVLIIIGAIV
jgi:hypothetical protein